MDISPTVVTALKSTFACSHERSIAYYIESINSACSFQAYPCKTFDDFKVRARSFGRVNKYPTMHHMRFPRHTPPSDSLQDYCGVFLWSRVINCIVRMVSTCPIWRNIVRLWCQLFWDDYSLSKHACHVDDRRILDLLKSNSFWTHLSVKISINWCTKHVQSGEGLCEKSISMCSVILFLALKNTFACSHLRAVQYFTESINSECSFMAFPCQSFDDFKVRIRFNCENFTVD